MDEKYQKQNPNDGFKLNHHSRADPGTLFQRSVALGAFTRLFTAD